MTENLDKTANLKPLYAARLAEDLEHNTAEQERLAREMAALEEQLDTLRHNQALLVNMQQALGDAEEADAKSVSTAAVKAPVPRQAAAAVGQQSKNKAGREKKNGSAPTLRDLVVRHLSKNGEPLSALEVTDALAVTHPERNIKITVVRSTLEAMVAKGMVRRNKQGKSVFYTTDTSVTGKKQPAAL